MTIQDAALLGVVQGLTEFLPVSSSGHLVFFQNLLGFKESMLAFDIMVHWGTLVAVLIYFWKDVFNMVREFFLFLGGLFRKESIDDLFAKYPFALVSWYVILATLPTVAIGLFFRDAFTLMYESVVAVGIAWFFLGVFLIASKNFQSGDRVLALLNSRDAFLIGVAQGLAIMPGISRSGITILIAMLLGIQREEGARFSFLMSIPAIIGAGVLELRHGFHFNGDGSILAVGFFVSAIVGYISILYLLRLVQKGKFHLFGHYCVFMSVVVLIWKLAEKFMA